ILGGAARVALQHLLDEWGVLALGIFLGGGVFGGGEGGLLGDFFMFALIVGMEFFLAHFFGAFFLFGYLLI
ncbi:hypothetical protein, partial [Stenotrophomonas maltophilia]|uniref:hypothetical protein n=1 Tax=Stenotrophomonas maltophilia TaxID=40324 RepID=UPI00313F18BE